MGNSAAGLAMLVGLAGGVIAIWGRRTGQDFVMIGGGIIAGIAILVAFQN